jgi:SAM-dependent methyltransferase
VSSIHTLTTEARMSNELELLAQKYKLLSYHVPYLTQFLSVYDVKGKDVLEVGGAMPREIVIDHLGANSWTCTESPQYDEELGEANQQTLSGATSAGGNYHTLLKNVEDFGLEQEGQFDCIFSIACFEHIAKFPQALDTMYRCLKPGGVMFSMYSPIWSSFSGAHIGHLSVPDRFDATRTDGQILLYWEHLLKPRYALHKTLEARFDRAFADEVLYLVHNSPHINRYYTEDYMQFIQDSKFTINQMLLTFRMPMPEGYQAALELACPGYKHFDNQGLYLVLTKP